jgi:PE family
MSFVYAQPEALATAAGTLRAIGSGLAAQNAAAAPPTTGVVPAAADQVSILNAALFATAGDGDSRDICQRIGFQLGIVCGH